MRTVDLDLRTPKEMGGPGGAGTNPEQLFAAGYAFNVADEGKYVLSVELVAE